MSGGWAWLPGLPIVTVPVTDWPQPPAGLGSVALLLGSASACPAVTLRVTDWPQSPAGLSGSRFLRYVGGAGPRRGTSSQTAWCGVSRFKTAVCAVCCGGTPTRPHPTVSYAANRRGVDEAVTDTGPLHSSHREGFRSPQRSMGTVCLFSSHRRDDADETEGRGRAGVPPQQTAHTAALKRLTPHLAVCEEVPRCGPARPNRRTNREPSQPGRRLRPVFDRHGRDGARPPTARPAVEAELVTGTGKPESRNQQPGRRLRPVGERCGRTGAAGRHPCWAGGR